MALLKILLDSGNKMVLESTLYSLMEEVRSKQLMDICMREVSRKWLQAV